MSNTAALALFVASLFVGLVAYYGWTKWEHELAHEIVTGVDRSTSLPLPATWRLHLLRTRYVYIALSMTVSAALVAAVSFQVGRLATDPGTKVVAYFLAWVTASLSVGHPIHATIEFLALRKLLRRTKAD